jgi:ABC-type Fe3+-hydroxamate transport system substrate-binding protein
MNAIDAGGTRHRRCDDRTKLRIVSLVPSLTELLCDLGLGNSIVGRTGFCIHPADEVLHIPKVGGTKDVNVEKIRQLAPTHLIVNIDENEKPTVDALEAFVPHVIVTHPLQPRDNLGLYRLFGEVFACEREADRLCARFEAAWEALMDARASAQWPSRRVLYLIWKDPWMTIARATYIAAMLEAVGWSQIGVDDARDETVSSSARYPAIDLARAARSADLVLLSSEPYRFTDSHVTALAKLGPDVRLVDGEMLSWYGSRAIAGLGYLGTLAAAPSTSPI